MSNDGNANMVLKIAAGAVTTLLTLAIAAIASNLVTLNREMIEMRAWREQLATSATVPRSEIDLREKILAAEIAQVRLRVEAMERRQ